MAVKAVVKYQSEDGKIHDDAVTARKYDATQRNMAAIRTAIQTASPGFSMGTLHIDLVNKPHAAQQLRDALNKVLETHRHYGKLKSQ